MRHHGDRPPNELLIDALVALLPRAGSRQALGFTSEAREDAIMDAIVRLLEAEQHDSAALGSAVDATALRYASRIVQRRLIDTFRRERSRAGVMPAGEAGIDETNDSSPGIVYDPRLKAARQLLSELDASDRTLLESYFLGPEAFQEEVSRQQLRSGTARVRIHRALKRLRERGASLGPAIR